MGILQSLFGGSKSKATSENKAFPFLQGALQPAVTGGVNALNNLNSELGGGFEGYMDKAGFDFQLGEGLKGIAGAKAAQGLLRSGSHGRSIADYATKLKSTMYDNFLNKLAMPAQLGLGAAGALAGAGQTST